MPYDRNELSAVAQDLASRGYAVWNIEYRRIGEAGCGWTETLHDAALAVEHLTTLVADGFELDLDRVVAAGHSAGGQLALWVAAQNKSLPFGTPTRIRPIAAVGLAAVVDLASSNSLNAGNGAVSQFLNGVPEQHPERYAAASPIEMLPLGVRQLIMHGALEEALPIAFSRHYVSAALAAGDQVEFLELARAGHMDYLDPCSEAHAALCKWLAQVINIK